jgi:hypothetical protein
VLQITQLDTVLEIFDEEEQAIRSFGTMRAMRAG